METFYIIVVVVATIVLILLLTIIGIILSQKNNVKVFPPSKNTCPDYWNAKENTDKKIVCNINQKNIGDIQSNDQGYKITLDQNLSKTDKTWTFAPGFVGDTTNTINFNDEKWASSYSTTQQCALKKWTNQHNIMWDGISNFNGC